MLGRPFKGDKICSIDGCGRPHVARGYCFKHYTQAKKRGDFTANKTGQYVRCTVDGCELPHYGRSYCRKHYVKYITYSHRRHLEHPCLATECNKKTDGIFCLPHQKQYNNPKTTIRGELNPRWRGGTSYYPQHYTMKLLRKELILERGKQCEHCGKEGLVHLHHLDKSRDHHIKSNCILLCVPCHLGIYHKGHKGRGKSVRHGHGQQQFNINEISKMVGVSYKTASKYFSDPSSLSEVNYNKIDSLMKGNNAYLHNNDYKRPYRGES